MTLRYALVAMAILLASCDPAVPPTGIAPPADTTPQTGDTNATPAGAPQFAVVRSPRSGTADVTGGGGSTPAADSWWMVVLDSSGKVIDSVLGLPAQSPVDWSPDATRIAYGDSDGLVIRDMTTGQNTRIRISPARNAYRPAWSPDGTKIAFEAFTGNDSTWFDIHVVNADGTGLRNLTKSFGGDWNPSWSPDGTKIAFVSSRKQPVACCVYPYPYMDVFIMNADGTNQTRVTDDALFDDGPAWSPDGSRILFTRETAGDLRLHTIRPDGSELSLIATPTEVDQHAKWSPDGTRIAYSSRPPGASPGPEAAWDYEIFTIKPDGSGFTRVTNNAVSDIYVSWAPVKKG